MDEQTFDSETLLVLGLIFAAVAAVATVCYFWFLLILWLLFGIACVAAVICGLLAMDSEYPTKGNWIFGAVIAAFAAIGLWQGIGTHSIDIPKLPKSATAKEITREYRDRVTHIAIMYTSKKTDWFSSQVVEGGGSGSGLLIANDRRHGIVITNRHVVDPIFSGEVDNVIEAMYRVKLASEDDWFEARVAAKHRSLDLAILIIDKRFPRRGAVRVASHSMIEQGDEVVALGNPFGVEFVTTEGIISKRDRDGVLTSCPINSGNSGGPLLLKNRGLVAGFNTWSRIDAQNYNYAVGAERVFRSYTPDEPARRKNDDSLIWLILGLFNWLGGGSSSVTNHWDDWEWYGDRETVVELLEMVPIEQPK